MSKFENISDVSAQNVLSLFGSSFEDRRDSVKEIFNRVEADLVLDAESGSLPENNSAHRLVATIDQYPDESIYILETQLQQMQENLKRIKFYLSDLKDLLPN